MNFSHPDRGLDFPAEFSKNCSVDCHELTFPGQQPPAIINVSPSNALGPGARGDSGSVGGPGMIDGLAAEAYSQIITVPPDAWQLSYETITFNIESWYSPTLKVTLLYKTSDSRDGETTMRVTNIKPGEPDPSLFQVPPGYRTIEEKSSFTIKYAGP